MRALAPTLALAVALAGCKKGDDSPTDPLGGVILTNRDSSARFAPEPKIVNEVRFRAFVAWDAVLGEIVDPVIDGQQYVSVYQIILAEDGWSDADATSSCILRVGLAGMTMSPNAKGEGFVWGLDIPTGPKDTWHDCTENGFDLEEFPEGWLIEDFAADGWSMRFHAPLTPDLADWLTPDPITADFEINHFTGGDWWSEDDQFDTEADSNYWYGYAMDDLHNVDFEAPLDQRYGMVDVNGDLAQGYYVFDQTSYWYELEPSN